MQIVALLTGRGNNSLKDKNVLPVLGKPIMTYPAQAARDSKYINKFYVSSENRKILSLGALMGYEKIVRTKDLARSTSLHYDVIIHAINELKKRSIYPDILVVLLANSATIKTTWIDDCIEVLLKDQSATAAVPVVLDLDRHPIRAKRINSGGYLSSFFPEKATHVSTNRQALEPSYFLCHNFWTIRVRSGILENKGQGPWSFMGKRPVPYIVEQSFDVHSNEDLKLTTEWLRKNL